MSYPLFYAAVWTERLLWATPSWSAAADELAGERHDVPVRVGAAAGVRGAGAAAPSSAGARRSRSTWRTATSP
jgi:hypothetical protein